MRQELVFLINFIKLGYNNKLSFIVLSYYSNITIKFLNFLLKKNFIGGYDILSKKRIKISLRYVENIAVIQHLKLYSTSVHHLSFKRKNLFYEPKRKNLFKQIHITKQKTPKNKQNAINNLSNLYLKNKEILNINHVIINYFNNKIILRNNIKKIHQFDKDIKLMRVYKNSLMNNTLKGYSYLNQLGGLLLLNTIEGFVDHHQAYIKNMGGELICKID